MKEIELEKRQMSGETLKLFKKAARQENVSVNSLVWMLTDVFSNGVMRSRAHSDAPECVKLDGLIQEREQGMLSFIPWEWTEKAKNILAKAR
jgi:hypothetical protein